MGQGKKKDVSTGRLLIERQKFAPHLMVSAGVCYGGKGRLHFVDEKAKISAKLLHHQATAQPDRRLQVNPPRPIHLRARRGPSTHSSPGAGMDSTELPRLHSEGRMAAKFTRYEST